ncbi:hypothetical protein [Actinomadura sp. WMMA1423]|uniref:hypothetical protein n=1 Tax=Actinomadura sp. WMMA1423 TaxID=2591108 RepID=UPI00114722C1|nr:hypothetical protein [Actinomadura sp. WMMA1423]
MSILGRTYLDPGDRLSGYRRPPEPVTVLAQWRGTSRAHPPAPCPSWLHWHGRVKAGPRNVLVRRSDGRRDVIQFPRRLRRPPEGEPRA